jgi:SAM-dependent methyltransferase
MGKVDWESIAKRLGDDPASEMAVEMAMTALQQEIDVEEAARCLVETAGAAGHGVLHYLASVALHQARRIDEAAEELRSAQRERLSPNIGILEKRYPPRMQERFRFYTCHRKFDLVGKDVIEVGGLLPRSFVKAVDVASWKSIDLKVAEDFDDGFYGLVQGDAAAMPFPDRSADLVFSSSSFEHIEDLPAALAEMWRVLRPGGIVYSDWGPIWSSHEGHHIRGPAQKILHSAGVWPLEPWFHLARTRSEIREFLNEHLDPIGVTKVERAIFRRPQLNRLFFEDYVHILHSSPLKVQSLFFKVGKEPDEETLRLLKLRQPGRTHFDVNGFRAVLRRKED